MNRALLTLAASLALAASAAGQSMEVKAGSPLTFETLRVKSDVEEGVALVDVDQTFHNDTDRVQEGVYRFRLPADAVIHSFSLWIAGKEKQGKVFERRYARQVYDRIVRSQRDPALLEQIGWRTFRVSVFPIPPREDVRLRLKYAYVLPDDLGLHTLEVPIIEGGSRVNVCTFEATVRGRRGLAMLECVDRPHARVVMDEEESAVRWSAEDWTPDGPFVVRFMPRHEGFDLSVLTHREPGEEEGWFLVRVLPRLPEAVPLPRDVVFVFDRSGSMQGEKVEQARAALLHGLGTLRAGDRFNVITFASTASSLRRDELVPVNAETLDEARQHAKGIEASGGTNIDHALKKALALKNRASKRLFLVVFLTDGEPTLGEKNPDRIVANYRKASGGGVRLFALGVGRGAKDFLLTHLAEGSRGQAEYVREGQNLEIPLSSLFAKVGSPLLAAPSIRIQGVDVLDLVPNPLPDLYRDEALVLAGRYRGGGEATLTLTGSLGTGSIEAVIPVTFTSEATARPHVAQLWAKRKIDRLIDDLRLHPGVDEIRRSIVDLGVRYQVVTPYTSYLVVEPGYRMPDPVAQARPVAPSAPSAPDSSRGGGGHGGMYRGPSGEVPPNLRKPEDPAAAAGRVPPPSEGGTPTPPPEDDPAGIDDGTPVLVIPDSRPAPGIGSGPVAPRAPGAGSGGGGATTGSPRASKGGPAPTTFDNWRFWWGYNRDAILGLRSGLTRARTGVPAADEVISKGILPALLAIHDDRSLPADLRSEGILALGKIGASQPAVSQEIARRLIETMNDASGKSHDSEADSATMALGLLGRRDGRVVDALCTKLLDRRAKNQRARAIAAIALGFLALQPGEPGYERVTKAYREILISPDEPLNDMRIAVLVGIGLSGDATFLPALLDMVKEGHAYGAIRLEDLIQSYAAAAIGKIAERDSSVATRRTVEVLEKAMISAGPHTVRSSVIAFGQIGRQKGVDARLVARMVRALELIAKKGETQAGNFALISLGKIGGVVDDHNLRNRIYDMLRTAMKKGSYTSKPFAALSLGLMGRSPKLAEHRDVFREAVRFEFKEARGDPRNRGAYAFALGMLGDVEAVPDLAEVLEDRGAVKSLRGSCAIALGLIRDQGARKAIHAALAEPEDRDLRVDTAIAAGLLGDSSTIKTLLEILEDKKSSLFVQGSVSLAIGRTGDHRAVGPLVRILEDDKVADLNRALAAAALGLLGDLRDVPRLRELSRDVNYRAGVNVMQELLSRL